MTGVMQEVVVMRRYMVRLQDGLEKKMQLNQLNIVFFRSEVEEEIEVWKVEIIPQVREQLGSYHWVYIPLRFIKYYGVDKREEQVGVQPYPGEEEIKNVVLNDYRECHWRIFFQYNSGGVYGTKSLLHAKKWDV